MLSTERGTRNAERGTEARPAVPRSDFRVPRWSVGVQLLAQLPPPDRAQHADSTLQDTAALAPVVVTGVRLPAAPEMARGLQVSPTIGLPQGITVYVDGVRVNEPDANEVNFDLLPLEDVERVEVSYGPSVLLGRNSLGAAVNLVTRRGRAPANREIELSGGSYGRYEVKANAGDRLGRWDYYVGVRYEH